MTNFAIMKRFITTLLFAALAGAACHAQLAAPVQSDTLSIRSMKYQYHDIRPENWPFTQIIWTATTFVINGEEFKIEETFPMKVGRGFKVKSSGRTSTLELVERVNEIVINFSGYTLTCDRPAMNRTIDKVTTTVKEEVFPAVSEGFQQAKDAVKDAFGKK